MTHAVIGRPLPPPRHSRVGGFAAQWGPQILAVATMLAGALKFNEDALRTIRELQIVAAEQRSTNAELRTELDRLRKLHGEQSDELNKLRTNQAHWREFADAAFCALGARPPYGCPDVEYAPAPARGSTAPRIQPRVKAEPLEP